MCFANSQESGYASCRLHFYQLYWADIKTPQDTSQVTPLKPDSLTISCTRVDICAKKAIVATAKAMIQVREPPNRVRMDYLMDSPFSSFFVAFCIITCICSDCCRRFVLRDYKVFERQSIPGLD